MLDREVYVVVDKNNVYMYSVLGKELLHSVKGYHRAAHIFIEVFKGKFMLQKKAEHTENGGKWSSAVSGHVLASENYEEAAIREANEELGLEINREELVCVAEIGPESGITNGEFVKLFTYLLDPEAELIDLRSDEVDEIVIAPLDKVIEDVMRNENDYSPVFVELFDLFIEAGKDGGCV